MGTLDWPGSCHEPGTGHFYGTPLLSGPCDRGGGRIGMGRSEHVGCVTLGKGALRPGVGVCKELQAWEISLSPELWEAVEAVTAGAQSVRLSVVMRMADYICDSVRQALVPEPHNFCRRVL